MKFIIRNSLILISTFIALNSCPAQDDNPLKIERQKDYFGQKPIPVALEGFSGEALDVLKFDLYVQGFSFVAPAAAQYVIQGSDSGNVVGTVTDNVAHKALFSRNYSGASLRRQAHFFANDIVQAVQNGKGIGLSKIAFKSQSAYGKGEIYVADFDGNGAQAVTSDSAIVARPEWVPGHMGLYYTSYAHQNPDIFFHNLATGQRKVFAGYPGLNNSAAVSPDGSRVAMILSKGGRPNVYVCNADGSGLKRLTTGLEDSSPCWSPDGQWICFATKKSERRQLAKISPDGGEIHYLSTHGTPNPTEPDWSPDGKMDRLYLPSQWISSQVCVMAAVDGSIPPVVLVPGENSRGRQTRARWFTIMVRRSSNTVCA